jgi:hypothetical protein
MAKIVISRDNRQQHRSLMLGCDLDVASAGVHVRRVDPSFFSRDYKKLFAAPPQRDIARLRGYPEVGGTSVWV